MRIGLDSFTLRDFHLSPCAQLDWMKPRGLESIQFGGLGDDLGKLKEVKAHGDRLGIQTTIGVSSPNRHVSGKGAAELAREIELAAAAGWHELHSTLGSDANRYRHPSVPWKRQLEDSTALLEELRPVLRANRCRINLENHFDTTTFELVRLVERVGADICGICLDTANVALFGEHIEDATRRVAPYTHLTHIKDFVLYFTDKGIGRQTLPPGRGLVDWEAVLGILHAANPDLPLNIEDHKWLFGAEIFEDWWHDEQPDLSRRELAMTVKMAWQGQCEIASGKRPKPEDYEKIPHIEELEERVMAGKNHLLEILGKIGA